MTTGRMGRRPGYRLHTEAFDFILVVRRATQTLVAERAGISLGTLSDLRRDKGRASMDVAVRLARALDVDDPGVLFPELTHKFTAPPREGTKDARAAKASAA